MNFTKEEKAFFAKKAQEFIAQLNEENLSTDYQEQIFRKALLDIKMTRIFESKAARVQEVD